MITVRTLKRRTKEDLSNEIAEMLGVAPPNVSKGSSIESRFLEAVHRHLFKTSTGGTDTYRKTEHLLGRLNLPYDPRWDTSESQGNTGGGTVTARAFSTILSAVSGQKRCFLVPAGEIDALPLQIGGQNRPTNNAFVDAGPGSKLLTYRRNRASISIVGSSEVQAIRPGWTGPWRADFWKTSAFADPVIVAPVKISGNGVLEIAPESYATVLSESHLSSETQLSHPEDSDPWASDIADHIVDAYPPESLHISPLHVPARDSESSAPAAEHLPAYYEVPAMSNGIDRIVVTESDPDYLPLNRRASKAAEVRAILLATKALELAGWGLARDCQMDGVGYDLLFTRSGRDIHVEVKGIQGPDLVFNLTPKEWWRAQMDPDWFVVAVTSVLSPTQPQVQVVTSAQLLRGRRMSLGYRLWP